LKISSSRAHPLALLYRRLAATTVPMLALHWWRYRTLRLSISRATHKVARGTGLHPSAVQRCTHASTLRSRISALLMQRMGPQLLLRGLVRISPPVG
jgi:hypothetical protein